ncbi:MAG TPA: recombination-associated protein RdgC [Nitrococcus sp.]|nr:recombination-associated protein RdgC [Nitrococcus sp.]
MWFKNLCIYDLTEGFTLPAEALEQRLTQFVFQPVGRSELVAQGWVSPLGRPSQQLVHAANGALLLCLQQQSRILPPAVIRDALEERVTEIEEREARKLGRREKNRMKEEIVLDLLPRSFTCSKRTLGYIDPQHRWLVVDAASWRQAEEFTELLRAGLGTLPIRPLQAGANPQSVMTWWLAHDRTPSDIELGEETVLEDPHKAGAEIRAKRQNLAAGEIKGHIKAGKRPRRLAATWDQRLSCILDTDLSVKRLKFLDIVQEDAGDREPETAAERFDADFALMILELRRFIPRLLELFGEQDQERQAAGQPG